MIDRARIELLLDLHWPAEAEKLGGSGAPEVGRARLLPSRVPYRRVFPDTSFVVFLRALADYPTGRTEFVFQTASMEWRSSRESSPARSRPVGVLVADDLTEAADSLVRCVAGNLPETHST
jgi:hypothetical protein